MTDWFCKAASNSHFNSLLMRKAVLEGNFKSLRSSDLLQATHVKAKAIYLEFQNNLATLPPSCMCAMTFFFCFCFQLLEIL